MIPYPSDRRWQGNDWRRPLRVRVRRRAWRIRGYRRPGHPILSGRSRQYRLADWLLIVTDDRDFVARRNRTRGKRLAMWLLGTRHDNEAYAMWRATRREHRRRASWPPS